MQDHVHTVDLGDVDVASDASPAGLAVASPRLRAVAVDAAREGAALVAQLASVAVGADALARILQRCIEKTPFILCK
jgi:pantothenate kinase